MTHFTVLVVGEAEHLSEVRDIITESLAPFNEADEEYFSYSEETLSDSDLADITERATVNKVPLMEQMESWYPGVKLNEDGKYIYRSGGNPNGYWDWWVIGGRWSGLLTEFILPGTDPEMYGTGEPGVGGNEVGTDYAFVEALDMKKMISEGFCTAAILKNGEWIQPSTMGWFGMDHDRTETAENWKRKFMERMFEGTRPGFFVAVVDCHV